MRDFTYQLQPGVPVEFPFDGRAFHVQEATSAVIIKFDGREPVRREKTQGAIVQPFKSVRLESEVPQTVTITLGNETVVDGRASLSGASLSAEIEIANLIGQVPDVTVSASAVQIIPSNSNRSELSVGVPYESTNGIRIGNSAVASDRGLRVDPGQTITLKNKAAIFAIRDGASDVTVSITEHSKV